MSLEIKRKHKTERKNEKKKKRREESLPFTFTTAHLLSYPSPERPTSFSSSSFFFPLVTVKWAPSTSPSCRMHSRASPLTGGPPNLSSCVHARAFSCVTGKWGCSIRISVYLGPSWTPMTPVFSVGQIPPCPDSRTRPWVFLGGSRPPHPQSILCQRRGGKHHHEPSAEREKVRSPPKRDSRLIISSPISVVQHRRFTNRA